jgi:DNA-binding NtrC family response regulator
MSMKQTIFIITEDIIFQKLIEVPLTGKISDLRVVVCKSYQDVDELQCPLSSNLIILDDTLKGISLIEVIQHIPKHKRIISSIWFFTEIKTEPYIFKAYQMGVTRVILKPFDQHKIAIEILNQLDCSSNSNFIAR